MPGGHSHQSLRIWGLGQKSYQEHRDKARDQEAGTEIIPSRNRENRRSWERTMGERGRGRGGKQGWPEARGPVRSCQSFQAALILRLVSRKGEICEGKGSV